MRHLVLGGPPLQKAAKFEKDFQVVKRMYMCKFAYQCPMKPCSEGFFGLPLAMTKRNMALQWIGPIQRIQIILVIPSFEIWTKKSLRHMPCFGSTWAYCLFVPNIMLFLWNTNQNETFALGIPADLKLVESHFFRTINESNVCMAFFRFKCHHCNGEYSSAGVLASCLQLSPPS